MSTDFDIRLVQPLTLDQYEACKTRAVERIKQRIGDKPTRKQFEREYGAAWTVLDILALIVFTAALLVSSAHIITHMGLLSETSHNTALSAGITIGRDLYTVIHQLGFIALAEASMLLFMVMWSMNTHHLRGWRRYLSVPLILAMAAMIFVIVANWQSGIGLLESIMPPAFTVGIGFHLERLIVSSLKRRDEVTTRYLKALEVYEAASADPTQHPDYVPVLRQELWQKIVSLKANKEFADLPSRLKVIIVSRELERDQWAYQAQPEGWPQETRPLEQTVTPTQLSANGYNQEQPM